MIFHELGKAGCTSPPPYLPLYRSLKWRWHFCDEFIQFSNATQIAISSSDFYFLLPTVVFGCVCVCLRGVECVFLVFFFFVLGALFFCFLLCALFVFAFRNENSVPVAVAVTAVPQFNSRDKPILNVIQLQHKREVKDREGSKKWGRKVEMDCELNNTIREREQESDPVEKYRRR